MRNNVIRLVLSSETAAAFPLLDIDLTLLRAILDRLVPADDYPGAVAAGVDQYVLRQFAGDLAAEAPLLIAGLNAIDAEARHERQTHFAELGPDQQDACLRHIGQGQVRTPWPFSPTVFFERLCELAAEGYYADPENGGNKDAISWRMMGYDPKRPAKITAP